MRILHVVSALTKGGAERVVVELANHAVGEGHHAVVLAAAEAPHNLTAHLLRPDVDFRFVLGGQPSSRRAYRRLVPWILRHRAWLLSFDVIHCHLSFGSVFGTLLRVLRGKRARPAIVETYHAVGMTISSRRQSTAAALLQGRDAVAFVADDAYWQRFRKARPNGLFRIIENGVVAPPRRSAAQVEAYRKSVGIPKGKTLVGTIGRMLYERRPDLILQSFAELLKRSGTDAHLLLGGEGPERERLAEEAKRLGLDKRIHQPGLVVSPADAFGLLDLYLTVNVGPITGIAALEAALAGVPVVAVQLQPNYVARPDDWIWSSTDPEAIAAKVAELLADPAARRALAKRQQQHARKHHGVEVMAQAYDRLYEEALARRGQASRGNASAGNQR